MMKIFQMLLLSALCLAFFSCEDDTPPEENRMVVLKVKSPQQNAQFTEGQPVVLGLDLIEKQTEASIIISVNDQEFKTLKNFDVQESIELPDSLFSLGYNDIGVVLKNFKGKNHVEKRSVIFFSKTKPEVYEPKILGTFQHNTNHYTQGLEFLGNDLYEGAGQYAQSRVAQVNPSNGSTIREVQNADNIFGEGITILNNVLYQLTWTNKTCLVYDLLSLKKTKEFSYEGEGWGLTNDGQFLYMSNGSSTITVRDPKTFKEIRQFHVFSNTREYRMLNELEFAEGFLYANVYQENFILKIDPKDGRVVGVVDCSSLVELGKGAGEVLNGIAFHKNKKRFYLTGKYWEKMFEVIFEPKSEADFS